MTVVRPPKLTPREAPILDLIGKGLPSRAIITELGIAYYTLRQHRLAILRKLGLNTSAQLSAAAANMVGDLDSPNLAFKPVGTA